MEYSEATISRHPQSVSPFVPPGHTSGFTNFSAMLPALKGVGLVPYVGDHDRRDPVLSPMYADLKGFPPTLCMTSTRDHCLSGTVDFHRPMRLRQEESV